MTAGSATEALVGLDAAFDGTLAVAAHDHRAGERVVLRADAAMPTASVIKLAVLVAVFERARTRAISLDDRLAIRDEDRVAGSGVIHELSADTELTVRDLATLMVVVSDNMATNLLVDAAGGVDQVNRFVHGTLGLDAITLHRKLVFSGGDGPLAQAAPGDLVALIDGLLAGAVVSPEASREMLSMLSRQQFLDQVPRLLDRSAPPERLAVAAKTGMVDGVRADAGVLWLAGRPVSYAVMTAWEDDGARDLDARGQLVAAEAGRILVRELWPTGAGAPPLAEHPATEWARLRDAAAWPA